VSSGSTAKSSSKELNAAVASPSAPTASAADDDDDIAADDASTALALARTLATYVSTRKDAAAMHAMAISAATAATALVAAPPTPLTPPRPGATRRCRSRAGALPNVCARDAARETLAVSIVSERQRMRVLVHRTAKR
jgi:hypothetical protein